MASHVHAQSCRPFVAPWTIACQAPQSMELFRQEYWRGLPCPPPGDFPDPGIEPSSLASPAVAGGLLTTSATWEAISIALARWKVETEIDVTFTDNIKPTL